MPSYVKASSEVEFPAAKSPVGVESTGRYLDLRRGFLFYRIEQKTYAY
jgi:hypothetical protein